jgi:autotransporter-associated beta strand protein
VSYTNKVWFDDSLVGSGSSGIKGSIVVFDYGNAAGIYTSQAWRNFATSKGLSLTLMTGQDSFGDATSGVYNTSYGLTVLNNTLASAATQSGRGELGASTLPLVFAGVSRGGTAGAIGFGWQAGSNRTVAAIGYHGNSFNYLTTTPPAAASAIPVLYPMAQLDPTGAVTTRQGDIETAVRTTSTVASIGLSYGYRPRYGLYWTTTMQYGTSHASTGDDTYPIQWLGRVWDARYNAGTPGTLTAISNAASSKGTYTLSNTNTTNAAFTSLSTGTFTQKDGNIWLPAGGTSEWMAESASPTAGVQSLDTSFNTVYTAPDSLVNRRFVGAGTLSFSGSGTVTLAASGSTGPVTIAMTGGTVAVVRGATLRNAASTGGDWTANKAGLSVEAGSTLDVWNGNAVVVDALTGAGTVTIGISGSPGWAGTRSLTVGVNNGSGVFAGTIAGNPAVNGGTLNVTKTGTGTQTFSGSCTYTGTTTVNGGLLNVTGSLAGNGSDKVTLVSAGSTLAGNPAISRSRLTGQSYAGFGASESGGLNTTSQLLGGTNITGSDNAVTMQYRQRTAGESALGTGLGSDVLSLTGMVNSGAASGQTDVYVLQMSYSEAEMARVLGVTVSAFQTNESALISAGTLQLLYLNGSGTWVRAIAGNFGSAGNAILNYVGSWSAAGSPLTVGSCGVDPVNNVAWSVVDHNSEFAVGTVVGTAPVPDVGGLWAAAAGTMAVLRRVRR